MTDTTSAAPSLLPCAFCGKTHSLVIGAASEMWDADEHGQYPHTETYAVFCDASTDGRKGGCGGAGGYRLTKDDAIEAWNRRAPQPVARVPLTDDQITVDGLMMTPNSVLENCATAFEAGVRFAERAHGIGTEKGDSHG